MKHGALRSYKVHGCRCTKCTTANREHNREYRLNGPQHTGVIPEFEFGKWRQQAACLGRDDLVWFPEPPNNGKPGGAYTSDSTYRTDVARAKAVCATCPVRADCLTAALACPVTHDHGIRGGLTAAERLRIRKRQRRL